MKTLSREKIKKIIREEYEFVLNRLSEQVTSPGAVGAGEKAKKLAEKKGGAPAKLTPEQEKVWWDGREEGYTSLLRAHGRPKDITRLEDVGKILKNIKGLQKQTISKFSSGVNKMKASRALGVRAGLLDYSKLMKKASNAGAPTIPRIGAQPWKKHRDLWFHKIYTVALAVARAIIDAIKGAPTIPDADPFPAPAPGTEPRPKSGPKPRPRKRKGRKRCGEPGTEYGQQNFKPKTLKSKAPDPEYDRFYADLDKHKLTKWLYRGKKYGKDYWWGSRHRRAYIKLMCTIEAAGVSLKSAAPEPTPEPKPASGPASAEPAVAAAAKISWCEKRAWVDWPARTTMEVFLKKQEKKGMEYYKEYPNEAPKGWQKEVGERMRLRAQSLFDFARGRMRALGTGPEGVGATAIDSTLIKKIVYNSGTMEKDGFRKMSSNIKKMIDCELRWARGEFDKGAPGGSRGPETKETRTAPERAELVDPRAKFRKAIYATQNGDKLSIEFLRPVVVDTPVGKRTAFSTKRVYSGTVGKKRVSVSHEKILWKNRSNLTKGEFIKKIEEKGEPCSIVDCQRSTITRGGQKKSLKDFLANPTFP